MSDPENFIARWSRRKRQPVDAASETKSPPAQQAVPESAHVAKTDRKPGDPLAERSSVPEAPAPGFDLARLPPIESITAETDIRAFLAPGVPPDLARAALRRAWAADPKVRDFIGLAENAWDFNAPGAIPGFGPLEMTDELRRLVTEMVGRNLPPADAERSGPPSTTTQRGPPSVETSAELSLDATQISGLTIETNSDAEKDGWVKSDDESRNRDELTQPGTAHFAVQNNHEKPEHRQSIIRRPHGRALPK